MKNALFAGVSTKKDEEDSDEEEKKPKAEEEPAVADLLDFDSGPA